MPTASLKPCGQPGCQALTSSGRCDAHKSNDTRKSSGQRGYTYRWDRLSQSWRKRNPLCVVCESNDKVTPVALVDHIVPTHVAPDRMFDETNLQSLCRPCHKVKTDADLKIYGSAR